jgi:hypothetical protein
MAKRLKEELDSEGDSEYSYDSYSDESDAKMKAAEQEAADRKSAEQHARQNALKFKWNKKVNVTFDEHNAVVVQNKKFEWVKSRCDHAEIYIGNIPVDADLLSFFKFIDKLAEGMCSQIRYRIIDGHRFFAHATISGKSKKNLHIREFAAETASKIHGQYVKGISKNDRDIRKLKSYVAADSGPAVKIQAVVLG